MAQERYTVLQTTIQQWINSNFKRFSFISIRYTMPEGLLIVLIGILEEGE